MINSTKNHLVKKIINVDYPLYKKLLEKEIFKKVFENLPLVLIIVISLIIRIIAAGESFGFVHPDEVFQSIEMVHFRIFGKFGTGQTIPWEFRDDIEYGGARSWFFVFILVAIYRFLMLFGVTDPLELIFGARLFLSIFSLTTVIVAYLFGKEIYNKQVGLLTAFLCGIWWFFPFWASRTMTDSISSDLLFLSLFLVYKGIKKVCYKSKVIYTFFSGMILGVAFMLRFPSMLMAFPIGILLLVITIKELQRKIKMDKKVSWKEFLLIFLPIATFCFGLLLIVLIQGILDYFTWGSFLQAPINFFIYNIVLGYSSMHGTSPWYSYFAGFVTDFAWYFLPFFLFFFIIGIFEKKKLKTKIFLLGCVFFWLTVFSILGHKEFRFIFIVIPICFVFLGNGVIRIMSALYKKRYKILFLSSVLIFFSASSFLTTNIQLGFMWKWNSGICNAMYWVGNQNNVERVIVLENVWYTGGYAYLDMNVPCYFIRVLLSYPPWQSYNSTFCRSLYSQEGTFVIFCQNYLPYIKLIMLEFDLNHLATVYGVPDAYVYAQI